MKNRLALAIPAYNAEWCLPRLLESAKKQVIPFDEILVYNDCSKDNTKEIVLAYGAILIDGEVNKGCSFAKNAGLAHTTCNWIHFHDADDNLLPNFTTLAHQWMEKPDCPDVVLFDFEYRDNDTNELLSTSDFKAAELVKDPIRYAILNQINPFCGLYKVEKLRKVGGYDLFPEILYNEDVAFHCKLAIEGFTFNAEKEISIINYRVKNSMSGANVLKCAQAQFHVMKINAERVGDRYPAEIAYKLWIYAAILASKSDWETAKKAVKLAVSLNGTTPTNHSPLFTFMAKLAPYQAVVFREYLIRLFNRRK